MAYDINNNNGLNNWLPESPQNTLQNASQQSQSNAINAQLSQQLTQAYGNLTDYLGSSLSIQGWQNPATWHSTSGFPNTDLLQAIDDMALAIGILNAQIAAMQKVLDANGIVLPPPKSPESNRFEDIEA